MREHRRALNTLNQLCVRNSGLACGEVAQAWGAVANAGYVTLRAAVRRLTFAESSPADTLLESWFPVLTGWGSHFPDDFTVNYLWALFVADEAPRGQNSHDLPLFLRDLVFVWPRGPPSGAGHCCNSHSRFVEG